MEGRGYYRPELDTIRFVAFAMIFVHHVLPRTGPGDNGADRDFIHIIADACGFGMTLFFVLSAHLLTTLFLIERKNSPSINIYAFFMRRILRIWPLYFLGIGVGMAIESATHSAHEQSIFSGFWVFLGNWRYLSLPWDTNPMEPLWSISVEEQFYVVLPIALLIAGRRPAFAGAMVICIGCAALWIQGEMHLALDTTIWTNTLTHFVAFGTGMILAVMWDGHVARHGPIIRISALAVAVSLFLMAAAPFEGKGMGLASGGAPVVAGHLTATAACVALLIAARDWSGPKIEPLMRLGKISYGLYVWHMLALAIAATLIDADRLIVSGAGFVLTVLFATASYHWFERPFLLLKQRWVVVPSRPL